jgi:hypothetical protein
MEAQYELIRNARKDGGGTRRGGGAMIAASRLTGHDVEI